MENSVHLQDFPDLENLATDKALVTTMDEIRAICSCALAIRDKHNLRVRLPLKKIIIISHNSQKLEEFSSLVQEEINVKNIEFSTKVEDFAQQKLQLNFSSLGKKFGSQMPLLQRAIGTEKWQLNTDGTLQVADWHLMTDDFSCSWEPKQVDIFAVEGYATLMWLDLEITTELRQEGAVRDLVRIIQQLRRDSHLQITDRLHLVVETEDEFLRISVEKYRNYIQEQTLAVNLELNGQRQLEFSCKSELEKRKIVVSFSIFTN
jgi:isoleucyl-tRNA synthetase